ncbi:uncharacterized protein VP01_10g7 [Puccinia sorghi]|uniref:Uncharacterized protein n=1 Tax=Puccinia sorghi TaxID=27349 RepID=A0A0L6VSW3_9BASI|nr:uncharacterized protein VP01_10g7 [Puccinia sorghi]
MPVRVVHHELILVRIAKDETIPNPNTQETSNASEQSPVIAAKLIGFEDQSNITVGHARFFGKDRNPVMFLPGQGRKRAMAYWSVSTELNTALTCEADEQTSVEILLINWPRYLEYLTEAILRFKMLKATSSKNVGEFHICLMSTIGEDWAFNYVANHQNQTYCPRFGIRQPAIQRMRQNHLLRRTSGMLKGNTGYMPLIKPGQLGSGDSKTPRTVSHQIHGVMGTSAKSGQDKRFGQTIFCLSPTWFCTILDVSNLIGDSSTKQSRAVLALETQQTSVTVIYKTKHPTAVSIRRLKTEGLKLPPKKTTFNDIPTSQICLEWTNGVKPGMQRSFFNNSQCCGCISENCTLITDLKKNLKSSQESKIQKAGVFFTVDNLPGDVMGGFPFSVWQRERSLEKFRQDPKVQLLLETIGAGGVVIDLTSAQKGYLMVSQPDDAWENFLRTHRESKKLQEPCWNLSVERQATDRAYCLGQTCLTHIICYFVEGSIKVNMMEVHLIEYSQDLRVLKQVIIERLYTHTCRYKKGSKSWHNVLIGGSQRSSSNLVLCM